MPDAHRQARQLLIHGAYAQAEAAYAEILAAAPKDAEAWVGYSKALANLQCYTEALDAAHQALTLVPDLADAYYVVGWVLIQLDRWGEAEAHLRRAMALVPTEAKYHLAAAGCARQRRDLEDMLVYLEAAHALNPDAFTKPRRRALHYARVAAGVEKQGGLVGWILFATLLFLGYRWPWAACASLPFVLVGGIQLARGRRRRGVWAFVLWGLWLGALLLLDRLWLAGLGA